MPLFRYEAFETSGKSLSHVIDADSLSAAKEKLRREKILVVRIEPLQGKEKPLKASSSLLVSFTRELSQLLKAGLPLYESLVTIEEKYRKTPSHPLLLTLCDHIKGGSPFSSILKKYPSLFSPVYLAMVQVGEGSGNLPFAIECLYQLLTKQDKLKKDLTSALTYPALLGCFCFCIVCGLFFFMVPSMEALFEGRALHPMTSVILSISRFLNAHVSWLITFLVGAAATTVISFFHSGVRLKIGALTLKIPYLNRMIFDSNWARFFRVLSLLLKGGLPLVEALRLSSQVLTCLPLQKMIERAEAGILEGRPLSEAFQRESLMPPLVFRMSALAEETGNMGEAFESLASLYEEDLNKDLSQLTTYLQPALLILLGGIVGLVILSILLPLTDVSSFLSQ